MKRHFNSFHLVVCIFALSALTSIASAGENPSAPPEDLGFDIPGFQLSQYLTLKDVKIRELAVSAEKALPTPDNKSPLIDDLDLSKIVLDKIVTLGKTIWQIVESNKPVVHVTSESVNALPEGANEWQSLEGWQAPQTHVYEVTFTNFYNMNVVDFTYRILFTAGGNVRGAGSYLSHVTVVPADLNVSWGYTFNANSSVASVLNSGTKANPVASMELLVKWSVDTVFKHSEGSKSFNVRGNGTFEDVSN